MDRDADWSGGSGYDPHGFRRTRTTLIERLAQALVDGSPIDEQQWRRDVEDFVTDYRAAVIAVCRQRHAEAAAEAADRFLGEVIVDPKSLRNWNPDGGSFRGYLQGWLRNYGPKQAREDLTREHRRKRGGDAHDASLAGDQASIDEFDEAEQRAWVREVVQVALGRLHRHALARGGPAETSDAWLIARDYGIPLSGEDRRHPLRLERVALAEQLGITGESLRNKISKARKRLLQYLERAIRDTAGTEVDMRAEREWFFGMLDQAHPGLGQAYRGDHGRP